MTPDWKNTPDLKKDLSWSGGIPQGINLRRRLHFRRGWELLIRGSLRTLDCPKFMEKKMGNIKK